LFASSPCACSSPGATLTLSTLRKHTTLLCSTTHRARQLVNKMVKTTPADAFGYLAAEFAALAKPATAHHLKGREVRRLLLWWWCS
jgi:hypothetical protein